MNKTKILELAGQLVLASVTGNDEEADKIFSDIADLIRSPDSKKEDAAFTPPHSDLINNSNKSNSRKKK